jgi:lipopolysaccharide/colanic/teichoic acid biosynthesis glycosyltransferase
MAYLTFTYLLRTLIVNQDTSWAIEEITGIDLVFDRRGSQIMKASEQYKREPYSVSLGLTLNRFHPSTRSGLKRLIDILGAIIGLIALAIVFIPIVVAIQVDNPGPIFYEQERHGLHGKTFRIRKFRSMIVNAEQLKHAVDNEANGLVFKNRNDPRITRIGRILRKTSLDEFPQFWNVLMGEMSLVGTRPPTRDEVQHYQSHHWRRLDVKPGITGEWQVHGRSAILDFEQIVHLDLRYQERWSIFYDLLLILRTFQVVMTGRGAF